MKTKEFNLSDKRRALKTIDNCEGYGYTDIDVKEFIKKLKGRAYVNEMDLFVIDVDALNELAGNKLK